MLMLAAMPLPVGMLLALVGGLVAGAAVNWAVYSLAWYGRPISPWSPPHPDAPRRRASDRLPLVGWWGLRRETALHGARFWWRPVAVELGMAAAWAALYWWEVGVQGLVRPQLEELAGGALPAGVGLAPFGAVAATFIAHAVLLTLMTVTSLVDIDEKLVPDEVTIPGTLLGLALAAILPASLLPHVDVRAAVDGAAHALALPANAALPQGTLVVEPVTVASPNVWPAALDGAGGLSIGLAAYATWCFALAPRVWRGRRGAVYALMILLARAARELARPPLAWLELAGVVGIVGVWLVGGAAWMGLLTALVGVVGGGAMVWAVRIVGSAALQREAMGFGDVTFMMMVGAFLGWQAGIVIFFLAPFAGLIVGLAQLVLRRDDVIPYVPYLCVAAIVVMVRWGDVWNARLGGLQSLFAVGWLIPAVLSICVVMLGAALVLWRNLKTAIFGAA